MDPVLENVLVELLVDLPGDADVPVLSRQLERTGIWSDLHLSDPSVLLGWGRPFPSVEEMNWHLLRNWSRRVDAGDTVICLGDVAHPDAWRDDRLVLDLAECRRATPGPRQSRPRRSGTASSWFPQDLPDRVVRHRSAVGADGHTALKVPAGAVNVHGHLHRAAGPTDRHVNVSVEDTDYPPVGLTYVLKLPAGAPEPSVATLRLDLP